MARDSNGVTVKNVKDRLIRLKEFFVVKLYHEAPSLVPNIADTFVEPYDYNCWLATEEEIIPVIHKLKANKTPREDRLKYCP
ncbi:unnamed protein product [Dracunculus medinensis]|uniref:Integrase n=1 Tax=Dracunculus medinensis TaxID=318479 RepID=A0A0N4UFQ3_DRAME|nr:unnamed protein product [Dracunculus medinensis]